MSMRAATALLCTLLMVAGCGWQLRGPTDVALDSVTLGGGSLALNSELREALEQSDVVIRSNSGNALTITRERWQSRVIAVDSLGRALEQELRYELGWQLQQQDQPPLQRQLVVTRSYSFTPDNAGGASDEAQRTRTMMINDAVNRMLLQLRAGIQTTAQDAP